MAYTRGSDILSALKYFYSVYNHADAEKLAACNSILEVIRMVYEYEGEASNITELLNGIADRYLNNSDNNDQPGI